MENILINFTSPESNLTKVKFTTNFLKLLQIFTKFYNLSRIFIIFTIFYKLLQIFSNFNLLQIFPFHKFLQISTNFHKFLKNFRKFLTIFIATTLNYFFVFGGSSYIIPLSFTVDENNKLFHVYSLICKDGDNTVTNPPYNSNGDYTTVYSVYHFNGNVPFIGNVT